MTQHLQIELTDNEYVLLQGLCQISTRYLEAIAFRTEDPIYEIAIELQRKGLVDIHVTCSMDDLECRMSSAGVFIMGWQSAQPIRSRDEAAKMKEKE